MTIASEIERIQGNIADTYDALEAKGATMPATENSANLASTVATIPDKNKYGCTIDNLLGDVDANGVYQLPNGTDDIVVSGVVSVGTGAYSGCDFSYRFYETNMNSLAFPDLENTVKNSSFSNFCAFSNVKSVSFPKLKSLAKTTFISAFTSCYYLENIYFNGLTNTSFGTNTDQFTAMFNIGTGSSTQSGTCSVHFPSNLQSTISGLSGYPTFGGNSSGIILAFDLPATS